MLPQKPSILLTRPRAQSEVFATALLQNGVASQVVQSPLLKIQPTGAKPQLEGISAVIFTSANAIDYVPSQNVNAWCVGDQTARKAELAGWQAVSTGGTVEDLVAELKAQRPEGRLLHIRGKHSRGQVAKQLVEAGLVTDESIVYRQEAQPLTEEAQALLSGESPVIVPLFSPRTAMLFCQSGPYSAPIWGVAMSQAVAQQMHGIEPEKLRIAEAPNAEFMLKSIVSLIDAA